MKSVAWTGDAGFKVALKRLLSQAMGLILLQLWPVGQHNVASVAVLLSARQYVSFEQQKPKGKPLPHCVRFATPPHVESRGRRPSIYAASRAAARASCDGTVADTRQIAASFWDREVGMVIEIAQDVGQDDTLRVSQEEIERNESSSGNYSK